MGDTADVEDGGRKRIGSASGVGRAYPRATVSSQAIRIGRYMERAHGEIQSPRVFGHEFAGVTKRRNLPVSSLTQTPYCSLNGSDPPSTQKRSSCMPKRALEYSNDVTKLRIRGSIFPSLTQCLGIQFSVRRSLGKERIVSFSFVVYSIVPNHLPEIYFPQYHMNTICLRGIRPRHASD